MAGQLLMQLKTKSENIGVKDSQYLFKSDWLERFKKLPSKIFQVCFSENNDFCTCGELVVQQMNIRLLHYTQHCKR